MKYPKNIPAEFKTENLALTNQGYIFSKKMLDFVLIGGVKNNEETWCDGQERPVITPDEDGERVVESYDQLPEDEDHEKGMLDLIKSIVNTVVQSHDPSSDFMRNALHNS